MTITEFLLARVAEDEADARAAVKYEQAVLEAKPGWEVVYAWAVLLNNPGVGGSHDLQPGSPSPQRVLAECEAKRRIVERAADTAAWDHHDEYAAEALGLETAIGLLAAVYSDHPDFQQEWKL